VNEDNKPGDVANGRILTAAGWLPMRRLPPGSPGPYYAGDLLDGRAFTGEGWVYVPVEEAAKAPRADGLAYVAPVAALAPRSAGGGFLKALGIGLAVIVGLGVVGGVIGAVKDEHPSAGAVSAATPTGQATGEKPKPAPATVAPDPEASYAAEMKRLGWVEAGNGLWLQKAFECSSDGYLARVKGVITNGSGVTKRYASISFGLYDDSGSLLGNAMANITNLGAGEKWKFEAIGMPGDYARCGVANVTAW
jgi:hypothetical protein